MIAVKDGLLSRNPVSAKKFSPKAKRSRYYTDSELTLIQAHMQNNHWDLVAFAIETGLRRADQFSLKWSQVTLESSTVVIPLPKGGKTLHIPLSEFAKDILRSLNSFLTSPYVFPSPDNPLKARSPICFIAKVFKPALRKAGISDGRWHDLRHTAASRRVMAGVDLYAVKEILGHRDISTTVRYAHLSPGYLQGAINRGSLVRTGTKTGTSEEGSHLPEIVGKIEALERKDEMDWLGDQESNLGSKIQKGETPLNLKLMRLIDEQFLATPYYSSRQMARWLRRQGYCVGRHRVRRFMALMRLRAIYQEPRTSQPHPHHRIYPYFLRNLAIEKSNQVWCTNITHFPRSNEDFYIW